MFEKLRKGFAQFGPGLLYAGAAVGVSHLVQSTRAGADFGFSLIWVVVIMNIIKYPIFEIGPRYAAATGQTLLDGYLKIGRWAVLLYAFMSIATMFIIMAAITLVTSGLLHQLTGFGADIKLLGLILLVSSSIILVVAGSSMNERFMKMIVITLTFCTMIALLFAVIEPMETQPEFLQSFSFSDRSHILFLVALIGWMPAPVDIVIWHSVWSVSKNKERGSRMSLSMALRDFKVGYWGRTFLAVAFLSLGALMMYGTGNKPSTSAVGFAEQLVQLYTYHFGQWAFPFIALAAFTTMFSTLLTCLDAFPRTLRKSTKLLIPKLDDKRKHQQLYRYWIVFTVVGTAVVLFYFGHDMGDMVDFATTISFVLAPILAFLNYKAMNHASIESAFKQPAWLGKFGLVSITILALISILFLIY